MPQAADRRTRNYKLSERQREERNGLFAPINEAPIFDYDLSCRREAARCFVSLNISLTHSRSLKVIRNNTIG